MALNKEQIEQFVNDGFVRLEGVVSPEDLKAGQDVIWKDLGYDEANPKTWAKPVVHLVPSDSTPFKTVFENPELTEALDQLVGSGRWVPRSNLGNFVVRFPHEEDANDSGWHIDSSFPGEESADSEDFSTWRVNARSKGRALLMLFLFSDVTDQDGPTKVRVGSHLDIAKALHPHGEEGVSSVEAGVLVDEASRGRQVVSATGRAGDVYLLHPFLAHAAQPIRGNRPRIIAQPGLEPKEPTHVSEDGDLLTPLERASKL